MATFVKRAICALLMGLFFLNPTHTFAQEAKLTHVIVTNTRDDLLLYFNVEGAFREEMKSAILSGVHTTFSFYITLYQVRHWWKDKKLADLTVIHTIKYNPIKKEYTIKRSWKNGEALVTQSFMEAQKLMTEINSLKIFPLNALEKGRRYQLRTKAKLSKVTFPLYLHYILFFVSLWDFETDWYTTEFIY